MTEYHDELPVTAYEARFTGRFEMPNGYGETLYKGHVAVFAVACLVNNNKAEYILRKDFEDEKLRRYVLDLESAVPLTGALRDQVILFIANGGQDAPALDFGTPTQSELAIDRLQQYIAKSWPAHLPEDVTAESLVLAAIEQLENYAAGVVPRPTAVPESPPDPVVELADEVLGPVEDVTEPEPIVTEPEPIPTEEETIPTEEEPIPTEAPQAIDVAALKARMAEGETPPRDPSSGLKVGDKAKAYEQGADEVDADGFPITIMDEVTVVGSVYPPGHTGRDRELIESL